MRVAGNPGPARRGPLAEESLVTADQPTAGSAAPPPVDASPANASTTASTKPPMVCGLASAATCRPASRAVPEVTGPMETTTAGTPPGPSRSTARSTVDDEVKAMASARPAAVTWSGSGRPATVR